MNNMTRRSFLKNAVIAVPSVFLGGLLAKIFLDSAPIQKASIQESAMYQAIGKKLMMVKDLPGGALERYEKDISVKSYVIPKRGQVP